MSHVTRSLRVSVYRKKISFKKNENVIVWWSLFCHHLMAHIFHYNVCFKRIGSNTMQVYIAIFSTFFIFTIVVFSLVSFVFLCLNCYLIKYYPFSKEKVSKLRVVCRILTFYWYYLTLSNRRKVFEIRLLCCLTIKIYF